MDFQSFQHQAKAELHVHLEGSMTLSRVMALAAENPDHPWFAKSKHDLESAFDTRSFGQFLIQFMQGYRLLSRAHHFQLVTQDLCGQFEAMGVTHAQVLYSPGIYIQRRNVPLAEIHDGIEAGLAAYPQLNVTFMVDTVLNTGLDFMSNTLKAVLADPRPWMRGFSVGGGDPILDMNEFVPIFKNADKAGLFCVAHAGELDGPANIQVLLEQTAVRRIAHGCNAVKDPSLLKLLASREIVIDVCLSSNLRTGTVVNLVKHPLASFLEYGIPVTLNTDDPLYFCTDLWREYQLAQCLLDCEDDVLEDFMATSLKAALSGGSLG